MPENDSVPSSCDPIFPPPETWRTHFARVALSRPVGILAGSITLGIFLGCMSLSIGCRTELDGITCQEGKVSLRCGEELDVYYPIPYVSPPNLEMSADPNDYEITAQKADHFRICCKVGHEPGGQHWSWKARGPKCASSGAAPTVIVNPPSPPPVPPPTSGAAIPPPEPIPVQTP